MVRVEAALHEAGVAVERDVPLGPMTTYRSGGPARLFVRVATPEELAVLAGSIANLNALSDSEIDVIVVGKGSNLLVADGGFDGVAIALGDGFATTEIEGTTVVAGAGCSLPVVARQTVAAGLTGFEWAVGVPGSIGGAVRMNAGGHGSDMSECVRSVRVIDLLTGQDSQMSLSDCLFAYRTSSIAAHRVVVSATLELAMGDKERSEADLAEIVRWRRANQPGGHNAGSVFTNPPGDSAGRLIDLAGCKGLRIGTAEVSTKHANFIQSDEGGSADDIAKLMAEVRQRVLSHHGVALHAETVMVGFEPGSGDNTGARQ